MQMVAVQRKSCGARSLIQIMTAVVVGVKAPIAASYQLHSMFQKSSFVACGQLGYAVRVAGDQFAATEAILGPALACR
jgi:hypothetical protein